MGAGNDILTVLARIEAKVDRLLAGGAAAPPPASDTDLDGQYGNEEIKKNPKRWDGDSMVGRKMSECPPEFLDVLASHFDYKAEREAEDSVNATDDETRASKKKYSGYSRKSAARARGWAARLRTGWKPPASEPSGDGW